MAQLGHAESFRDLAVYQRALRVALEIFEITKSFPKEEAYSLTDQVRRASRSVGAQIAEAWGKRPYRRHFVSKLTDADSEQLETQHWLEVATQCGYVQPETARRLAGDLGEVGRMLHSMIDKAASFCGPPTGVQEDEAFYDTPTADD